MNIRLLISVILVFILFSCRTISETTSYDYKNLSINIINDSIYDQQFDSILQPYKIMVEAKMSEVISMSNEGLISYRPESPLSNFLSDMILDFANDYCKKNRFEFNIQFSLFNHGGIRSSIPKGEITIKNAYELMPFENKLVLLQLTGEQVIILADYITTREGEGVSGIKFGMLGNKAVDIKIQGINVDAEKKYWMVTSDYIASGGDGMKVLTWADKTVQIDYFIRDVIIDHLKMKRDRGEMVDAKSDGRIYRVE